MTDVDKPVLLWGRTYYDAIILIESTYGLLSIKLRVFIAYYCI